MLQAPVFAVGIAGRPGLARVDQPQFAGDTQQRDVAEVAGQFGVLVGMAEDQVLDDELDVDDAARVMLEGEAGGAVQGVRVVHFLAHGDDVFLQLRKVARQTQDLDADFLETPANRRITGTETGPGQGLVFPGPGILQLIVAEGVHGNGEQAGIAVRAQAQVGFEQDAGGRLAR